MKKVIKCKLDPHKMGREIYDLHMDLQEEIWRCAKDLLEEKAISVSDGQR